MRALIDTNIILDYVLERHPFHHEAEEIVLRLAKKDFVGYISGITAINVYYTGRKLKGKDYTFFFERDAQICRKFGFLL